MMLHHSGNSVMTFQGQELKKEWFMNEVMMSVFSFQLCSRHI